MTVRPERVIDVRTSKIGPSMPTGVEGPTVYWMNRDKRVHQNWALLYAQSIGNPVVVNESSTNLFRTVSLTVSVGVETPAISVIALASYGQADAQLTSYDENGAAYQVAYSEIEGFVLTATETSRHFGQ